MAGRSPPLRFFVDSSCQCINHQGTGKMYDKQEHRSLVRFIPYALIAVNFVGWEVIKRTPVFVSPTISQKALRVHGVIAGSMLLIFTCILIVRFCLAGKRVFKINPFEKYLFLLLIVDLMAFVVGLIRHNALVFLVGDTYKFAVIPLAYFCTTQTLGTRDAKKLFLFIIILETAVTLESFSVYAVRLAVGIYGRTPEHSISLLAFVFFMVSLTSNDQLSRRRRNIYSAILVMIGITAMLSRARTLWLQVFLCPFILLLVERKTVVIRSLFRPAVFALVLLIPLSLFVGAMYRNVIGELGLRIGETLKLLRTTEQASAALSGDRRVVETKAALDVYLESPNILNFIAGMGNGAEFYAPSAALGMGSRPGYKHHLHNGYVSLFFRMGVVGLTLFLLFAFSMLRSMYVDIKHRHAGLIISRVIFVSFVLTLMELMTIYSFVGDIKWGVLFGLFRTINSELKG